MSDENKGIDPPNCTPIPNEVIDRLREITPEQGVIMLAICRHEFGYPFPDGHLVIKDIQAKTGLPASQILTSVIGLIKIGWLVEHDGNFKLNLGDE